MENKDLYSNLVKDLVNSNSFKQTIGAWLDEMRASALQKLLDIKMPDDSIWQLQAELKVVNSIYQRIDAQIQKAEKLRQEKLKKE